MTTTLMSTPLATSTSTSLALAAAVVPLSTPFLWRKITALARFDWASRWGKRQQSQAPFSVSALGFLYESTVGTFRTGLTALDCLDAPPGHGELLYARALEGDQAARDSVRFIQALSAGTKLPALALPEPETAEPEPEPVAAAAAIAPVPKQCTHSLKGEKKVSTPRRTAGSASLFTVVRADNRGVKPGKQPKTRLAPRSLREPAPAGAVRPKVPEAALAMPHLHGRRASDGLPRPAALASTATVAS